MTTKKPKGSDDDESRGILDDAASLDTTGIGILTNTAQVSVVLPHDADDDLDDDAVIEGEVAEIVLDEDDDQRGAIETDADIPSIVIELPADDAEAADEDAEVEAEPDPETVPESDAVEPEVVDLDIDDLDIDDLDIVEPDAVEPDAVESESAPESADERTDADIAAPEPSEPEPADVVTEVVDASSVEEPAAAETVAAENAAAEAAAAEAFVAKAAADLEEQRIVRAAATAVPSPAPLPSPAPSPAPVAEPAASAPVAPTPSPAPPRTRSRQGKAAASLGGLPRADAITDTSTAAQRRAAEPELTSKRLGELGDASRESADLLTAERLLDPSRLTKPEPEGAWSHLLYTLSGRRINIGDGRRARERKALSARIAAPLPGGARFVPVLSRKGGVGKTAVTALLGMALADAREDRVIAVDANPDRGTLADRVARGHHTRSVRDLVRIRDEVRGYHDLSAIVARDATRLDVLASDSDPRIAEAFSDTDYRDVAHVAAHYYSLVLTDTGTGIVHPVMTATLDLADQIVIVSGLSVDEARLASETLTWLEANGYSEQAHDAIVVLNQSTPGAPLVRLNELEAHFATRARKVVRMPYDPQIAGGGTIEFASLQPETRIAARELAAQLVEGLRVKVA